MIPMIKFSIITVVYNGEDQIRKTILSVINQTYKSIEYIIIDGYSQDNTLGICLQFESQVDRIISEQDDGLYDAMNKGIKLATGDYIIFMNCGDSFASENTLNDVSIQIDKSLHKTNPEFIYGDSIEESLDGNNVYYKKARSHKFAWYGMFTHHQSMIYKTDIINSNNISYNQKYFIAADYQFTGEFLKYCSSIEQMRIPICIFKQGGISSKWQKEGLKQQWIIRRSIFKYGIIKCFIITFILIIANLIRKFFAPVYNLFRFSRTKNKYQNESIKYQE